MMQTLNCQEEEDCMQFGAVLPTYEIPADPHAITEYAQAVEELGYHHLAIMDHVIGADPKHHPNPSGRTTMRGFHEPFVVMGYLAAVTKDLVLSTNVLILPQRQTIIAAKQAAEVDVLSGGRLRLGIGVGYVENEYTVLGEDFTTRGQRIEEQIAVMRALFTEEDVTYHGRWHTLDWMGIRPLPIQRPIPIWLGGDSDPVLRRVGALADGWMPLLEPDETARAAIAKVHAYARAAGRDPASIPIEAAIYRADKTPDDWRREIVAWEELGATSIVYYALDAGLASLEAHIETLERFKEAAGFAATP